MPLRQKEHIQNIKHMIKTLERWLLMLEEKPRSVETIELMACFDEEGILDILSDCYLE